MKKSLVTTLVAAPLLSLSSMAFAAEPVAAEPVVLSASQMDGVTAGAWDTAGLFQINVSPITAIQLNVLTFGPASNSLDILSGNIGSIHQ